jgi:hypothetical protein
VGQVVLQVGVAVNSTALLAGIEGVAGVTDTDFRVTTVTVTVIMVEVDTVVVPSVALT